MANTGPGIAQADTWRAAPLTREPGTSPVTCHPCQKGQKHSTSYLTPDPSVYALGTSRDVPTTPCSSAHLPTDREPSFSASGNLPCCFFATTLDSTKPSIAKNEPCQCRTHRSPFNPPANSHSPGNAPGIPSPPQGSCQDRVPLGPCPWPASWAGASRRFIRLTPVLRVQRAISKHILMHISPTLSASWGGHNSFPRVGFENHADAAGLPLLVQSPTVDASGLRMELRYDYVHGQRSCATALDPVVKRIEVPIGKVLNPVSYSWKPCGTTIDYNPRAISRSLRPRWSTASRFPRCPHTCRKGGALGQ